MNVASVLETLMIVSFGISWPMSIIRSWRSRSTKGKSLFFSCFILFGYLCGLSAKILNRTLYGVPFNLAFYFYIPNIIMVATDICLYFRNRRLEQQAE